MHALGGLAWETQLSSLWSGLYIPCTWYAVISHLPYILVPQLPAPEYGMGHGQAAKKAIERVDYISVQRTPAVPSVVLVLPVLLSPVGPAGAVSPSHLRFFFHSSHLLLSER